jgi:uncharacterized protein (UPF0276 family)
MTLPELGVGVAYSSGLEPLLEPGGLVDVIEVEPQTLWLQPDHRYAAYRLDEAAVDRVAALPGAKIVHGIGFAVGGTLPPETAQLGPLLATRAALGAPWISEHLAFNRAHGEAGTYTTAFMLPPRQSEAGVRAAVHSVRALRDVLPVPFAFENTVNYLRPRTDEMPDGEFVARVAEEADCGIVLDLHNAWCNERNGRQRVMDFVAALPLERVWEVHLAGGFERRGYWLDSHSGAIPAAVREIAATVLPQLPNLRALVYELFPQYLPVVGLDLVRRQIEACRTLWDRRLQRRAAAARSARRIAPAPAPKRDAGPAPEAWEDALAALVVGRPPADALGDALARDPGVAIVRELLGEFRASMTVEVLKLTFRLVALARGAEAFERLLAEYWHETPPQRFASAEAHGFAAFLAARALDVPYLEDVLAFERAALATLLDGKPRVVTFRHDPMAVLRPLTEGRLPDAPRAGEFEVEVTPPQAAPAPAAEEPAPRPAAAALVH